MRKYLKLNNNDNQLSLGNICRIIKNNSVSKIFAGQTDIFCALFNIDTISDSTVNNYCIGYRSIGPDYKNIYQTFEKNGYKDFENIALNIINILEGNIKNLENEEEIKKYLTQSPQVSKLCLDLYNLAKNDTSVPRNLTSEINKLITQKNYYEVLKKILTYAILVKPQPIYIDDNRYELVENILNDTNISVKELEKMLKLQMQDGINYTYSIKKLSREGNPYASFELGEMEYKGLMTGSPRYIESYKYLKVAEEKNHPRATWLIAKMFLEGKLTSDKEESIEEGFKYLKKAESLGSTAAINTLGTCYLTAQNPKHQIDEDKALNYFHKAASHNYVYAFNNLGKYYEQKGDRKTAFNYYLKSAELEESWACNKVGEYYRLGLYPEKDNKKAFNYYSISLDVPLELLTPWAPFNLAKYFYLEGNLELGLEPNQNKAIEYFKLAAQKGIPNAYEELIYIYLKKPETNISLIKDCLTKLSKTSYYDKIKDKLTEKLSKTKIIIVEKSILN